MKLAEQIYVTLLKEEYRAAKLAATELDNFDLKRLAKVATNMAEMFEKTLKHNVETYGGQEED